MISSVKTVSLLFVFICAAGCTRKAHSNRQLSSEKKETGQSKKAFSAVTGQGVGGNLLWIVPYIDTVQMAASDANEAATIASQLRSSVATQFETDRILKETLCNLEKVTNKLQPNSLKHDRRLMDAILHEEDSTLNVEVSIEGQFECYVFPQGCLDHNAQNYDEYNENPVYDDGSCIYPVDQVSVVLGCTDQNASNFNAAATDDDGSCITVNEPLPVFGCTDSNASNFNPYASDDDGSCIDTD